MHLKRPRETVDTMLNALLRRSATAGDEDRTRESALLRPEIAPRSWRETPPPSHGAERDTADLLRLFQRVELLFATSENLRGDIGRSPLHRPLACRQLLDEVERRMGQARRGYRSVVEVRSAVRGRVTAQSIARYVATGSPTLTCKFDELTESTELLGIIASSLDLIADGKGSSSRLPPPFDEQSLRSDAVRLRRAMSEVVSLPSGDAQWIGRRLRLNRLDQPLARSLRLALALLAEQEIVAKSAGHRDFQAAELSVETDKVWEWIVNAALRRSAFDHVLAQGPAQVGLLVDPWIKHPVQVVDACTPTTSRFRTTGSSSWMRSTR